ILLPGVAGVVVGVAVELDGQAELGPAAVDVAASRRPVRARERQAFGFEELEEAGFEVAEGHAGVTEEDGSQPCRAGGARATLEDGRHVARRGAVLDARFVAGASEVLGREDRGEVARVRGTRVTG